MGWEAWLTAVLLVGMLCTLISGRVGADIVLMGVLTALLLFGVLEPAQALRGFANEGVITIALLYVVTAGLKETGAMTMLTSALLGRPRSELAAQARIIGPVAGLSAFVNNTPIVAMFLPVLSGMSRRYNLAPSRLFMPLSFAAILGGLCTLIGTSTNLVVNSLILSELDRDPTTAQAVGMERFGMFTLAPVGLPIALAGLAYILLMGRRLLPAGARSDGPETDAREYTVAMRVEKGAPIVGRTLEEAGLRHLPGLFLSRIERDDAPIFAVGPEERLRENDVLVFVGVLDSVVDLQRTRGLAPVTAGDGPEGVRQLNRLVEVVISRSSPLVGQSIREGGFRTHYGAVVVAVHRHGTRLRGKLGDIVLRPGDTLLIEAPSGWINLHRDSSSFHLVSELPDAAAPRHERAWLAIVILACVVGAITFEVLAPVVAAMAGAGAMIALRCCTGPQARASVDWRVLIVIGAAFGVGSAMTQTGLAHEIAEGALSLVHAPLALLAIVYALTVLFTACITNNAAAALMFPIALQVATTAGLPFMPFAVCIAIGASAEFMTPLGYQTNLMVMGPGGYRWLDYTRFGGPLTLLCGLLCVPLSALAFGLL